MKNDLAVLITLDTMPCPVSAKTVAATVPQFWQGTLPSPEKTAAAVQESLQRLIETRDVKATPSRFSGLLYSLTDAGRANARQ